MFAWIAILIATDIAVRAALSDSFSQPAKYTLRQRVNKTLRVSLILLVYALYTSVNEVVAKANRPSNPYFILGLSRTATKREIASHSRILAKQFHPDRNPSPEATVRFNHIRTASNRLQNDAWRLAYDRFGDTLKPEYLTDAIAHPKALLIMFLWDSFQHTLSILGFQILFSLGDLKKGRLRHLVSYVVSCGALQAAVLWLRFSLLKPDATTVNTLMGKPAPLDQISFMDQVPFIRNLTMFERTRILASLGPLILALFRCVQPYWASILEEYEAQRLGQAWIPLMDQGRSSIPTIVSSLTEINKQVIYYCQARLSARGVKFSDALDDIGTVWTNCLPLVATSEAETKRLVAVGEELQATTLEDLHNETKIKTDEMSIKKSGWLWLKLPPVLYVMIFVGLNYLIYGK